MTGTILLGDQTTSGQISKNEIIFFRLADKR